MAETRARPGSGASLTTGEAAARRAALEEARQAALAVAIPEDAGPQEAHGRLTASLEAASNIRALMDRAPDVDAEAGHWQLRFQHSQEALVAARARIADLEQEVAEWKKWAKPLEEANERLNAKVFMLHNDADLDAARREGAEAMREAANRALLQEGYIYLAGLVRALPLPEPGA